MMTGSLTGAASPGRSDPAYVGRKIRISLSPLRLHLVLSHLVLVPHALEPVLSVQVSSRVRMNP